VGWRYFEDPIRSVSPQLQHSTAQQYSIELHFIILPLQNTIIHDNDSPIILQGFTALLSLLCNQHDNHTSNAPQNKASSSAIYSLQITDCFLLNRKDMKTAMQNKDSNRLSVLRALLTQTLNASKTSQPINTDMQMLALLRKSASASRAAAEEFKGAGREDLAEKEDLQVKIMEEYAGGVETMSEEQIREAVQGVLAKMKAEGTKIQVGDLLKKVFAPEVLGEKPVERGDVAKIARQLLAETP
jgi:uncharacterized protein YqeY